MNRLRGTITDRIPANPMRHYGAYASLATPFGPGWFGRFAEWFARFLGTPQYLIAQTSLVVAWIVANQLSIINADPFPYILLNLAFSTQAAYAAPMILLAQTRQAERDREWTDADVHHREELARTTVELIEQNTEMTRRIEELAQQIHQLAVVIDAHTEPA